MDAPLFADRRRWSFEIDDGISNRRENVFEIFLGLRGIFLARERIFLGNGSVRIIYVPLGVAGGCKQV